MAFSNTDTVLHPRFNFTWVEKRGAKGEIRRSKVVLRARSRLDVGFSCSCSGRRVDSAHLAAARLDGLARAAYRGGKGEVSIAFQAGKEGGERTDDVSPAFAAVLEFHIPSSKGEFDTMVFPG